MNSMELMSSMSTRSGTSRPRIAVASLVTYWPSSTGVRSTRMRSWLLWNRSTATCTPVRVAERHHTRTVPFAFSPNPARVTSGSGSVDAHADIAVESPSAPTRARKSLRESEPCDCMYPPVDADRSNRKRQPYPHGADVAVRPQALRHGDEPTGRAVRGSDLSGDHHAATEQVRAALGAQLRRVVGEQTQVVDHQPGVKVDLLDRIDQRSPLDRAGAVDGVDPGMPGGEPDRHRQVQHDRVAGPPAAGD